MVEPDDELLMKKACAGDQEALCTLFEGYGPGILGRIATNIPAQWRSLLTAEDVLQEAYTDAFLEIASFTPRGPDSFQAWLFTIARNNLRNAIDALEADKRGGGRRRIVPRSTDESLVALYDTLCVTHSTPSRQAAQAEAQTELLRAIDQLPDDHRRTVLAYDVEGRGIDEVAQELNRSAGAVFMLRSRAHRALRRIMGSSSRYFSDSP